MALTALARSRLRPSGFYLPHAIPPGIRRGAATPALLFKQGTGNVVQVTNAAALQGLAAVTVEAWVNVYLPSPGYAARIVGYSSGNAGWNLFSAQASNNPGFNWQVGNGTSLISASTPSHTYTGDIHVAGTWDGANVQLWVGGQLLSTAALSGGNTGNPAVNLFIGNNATSTGREHSGTVQEVRISNVARYTAAFVPRPAPFRQDANTVALWHLDEGSGQTAYDASGNGLNGTLAGTTRPTWLPAGYVGG